MQVDPDHQTGETVHSTLVALGSDGVLLRGPSGSGKSDLALRLIMPPSPWSLVSDDQVVLSRDRERITGRAPMPIAGKLEVRGIGIVQWPAREAAVIGLIVDLVPRPDVPRMPELGHRADLLGLAIPCIRLHAFDASTPAKIALLLSETIRAATDKI